MATLVIERRYSPAPFLLFAAICVIAGLLLFASQHANAKHGDIAETIDKTCRSWGKLTMTNPVTGRRAIVCLVNVNGEKKWGVAIYEKNQNVTAFLKEKMKDITQVKEYLRNVGYR